MTSFMEFMTSTFTVRHITRLAGLAPEEHFHSAFQTMGTTKNRTGCIAHIVTKPHFLWEKQCQWLKCIVLYSAKEVYGLSDICKSAKQYWGKINLVWFSQAISISLRFTGKLARFRDEVFLLRTSGNGKGHDFSTKYSRQKHVCLSIQCMSFFLIFCHLIILQYANHSC